MNNIIKPNKKIKKKRFWTGEKQDTRQLGCRTARIHDSLDTEQLRFRTAGMQERRDAGLEE